MLRAIFDILNLFSVIGLVTEIPEIVKVATTFMPALRELPVLGKIIPMFSAGEMDDTKALEELKRSGDKAKRTRQKLKDDNNSKVIKIKDALQCVEDNVFNGRILIAVGKGILSTILGRGGTQSAPDLLFDQIAKCMLAKALQQKNARSKGKYVKTKNTPEQYTELVDLRRGKLHPFIPAGEK